MAWLDFSVVVLGVFEEHVEAWANPYDRANAEIDTSFNYKVIIWAYFAHLGN